MANRKLVGENESITFNEAREFRDKAVAEFLYYMNRILNDAVEDDEEKANANVNMAKKLGDVVSMSELVGILKDADAYAEGLLGKAEVVEDGE